MRNVCFLFLLSISPIISQNSDFLQVVSNIKDEIGNSEGKEKLILMDSLARMIEFNEDLGYTPLAKETIDLAVDQGELEIATRFAGDLIYYNANILGNSEKALEIFEEFKSREIDFNNIPPVPLANYYLYAGDANFNIGKYDEALVHFNRARELAVAGGSKSREANIMRRLGYTKGSKGVFAEATLDIQKAITLFTELNDTLNMIRSKESMSILYSQNQFYEEAQKEREESYALFDENDPIHFGNHINAAYDFRLQGKNLEWLSSLKKSIEIAKSSDYIELYAPLLYSRLVVAYVKNDSLDSAKKYLNIMESDKNKYTSGQNYDGYLEANKQLALASNDIANAIRLGEEHLALKKQKESFVELSNAEKFLADAYKLTDDTNKANVHLVNHFRIKDSINNVQNVKSLSYYQTLYETEKRDNTIKAQEKDLALLAEKDKVRKQWFLLFGIIGILGVAGFVVYKNYRQKLERRIAVEQLRTKISADLHDDVGSLLTGLSMQTELLSRQVPDESKQKLERVSQISKDAMLKMRDAVWAMDARKDNWQSLADRMNEFAGEYLESKEIRYSVETNQIDLAENLPGGIRQNLYLIFKEAIANVLKHSNADMVNAKLSQTRNSITMLIEDNGTSKYKSAPAAGLGLSNMKLRAEQLNGKLHISQDAGFSLQLEIPRI